MFRIITILLFIKSKRVSLKQPAEEVKEAFKNAHDIVNNDNLKKHFEDLFQPKKWSKLKSRVINCQILIYELSKQFMQFPTQLLFTFVLIRI